MKEYRGEINRIIHHIKQSSGWTPGERKFDVRRMGLVSDSSACLNGESVNRKIFIFRSNGCHWARKNGCSMCGYYTETTGEQGIVRAEDYVAQLRRELEQTDFTDYPVVCLFTAGSFLDNWEFPWESAQEVFRLLGQEKGIRKVVIESCAEYVEEGKVALLRELIGDKIIEVGIGLESADPYVLRNCVNKDFTLEDYEHAAKILRKYFQVLSYVLVKPPFLTEREGLELAIQTGSYAFDCGSQSISLEPMYVEQYTLVDYLFRGGYLYNNESYRPPWLWTVFEAARQLRRLYPEREVRIGYSDELPTPYHVARNCDQCSDEAYQRIRSYAQTYDLSLFDSFDCACKRDWLSDLDNPNALPLDARLEHFVRAYHERQSSSVCLNS